MKPDHATGDAGEIELKLALPAAHVPSLARQIGRAPVLARRKPVRKHLHNVYYDTPEQTLRRQRVTLRVRRVGGDSDPQWLQTLKIGGSGDSALTQRGEWEVPISGPALDPDALRSTPWSGIDPSGEVFGNLIACFVTDFDRTSWLVRRRDASMVEVALDLGQVACGDKSAPICELELELLAGQPKALFEVARQIAGSVAVLPLNMSKSQRGYALALNTVHAPLRAQPPLLNSDMSLAQAARRAMLEMFGQFTSNLNALTVSDNPELVHQARVGWRRFKTGLRLFKSVDVTLGMPSWQALEPLRGFLGELRDLDVARTETLPPLAVPFTAGNARREVAWQALEQALTDGARLQREAVIRALAQPATGETLLATTQWLEGLATRGRPVDALTGQKQPSLRRWASRRIDRLSVQLKLALKNAADPESQHRARIVSKRLRYSIEALRALLPRKLAQRRYKRAAELQSTIGLARDLHQAAAISAKLEADAGLVEFLRGVAVGRDG